LSTTLNFNASSGHTTHFHTKPVDGFGAVSAAAEKDPFVSSNNASKGEQKLSPTASAFRPVSVPLVAHGSLSGMNIGQGANRQLFTPHATAKFSSDLGISRCLIFYAPSHPVTFSDVEGYLEVRSMVTLYYGLLATWWLTTNIEVGATWFAWPRQTLHS
jgi:hypothetical protein